MVAPARPKLLGLDTNFVLDLARQFDVAHELREVLLQKGYALRFAPTAVAELHEQFLATPSAEDREYARVALANLLRWRVQPFDLSDIEISIAEQFARRTLLARLLPPEEFNDALILAETSCAKIPLLVTSDKHLLHIDEDLLLLLFNEADLPPTRPVHPQRLLRALH
jgi:hypothetical protein